MFVFKRFSMLVFKRFYRRINENPVILEAVREIRLHLTKKANEHKNASAKKAFLGWSLNQAIGHLKSFESGAVNPNKAIVLNLKCSLTPEQYGPLPR